MSQINKALMGIQFAGAALVLASASWKNNVRAIYGFNAAGNGYTVFKPASNFNSLQQLEQNGSYILDVATPGFDLPGAVLPGAGTSVGEAGPKLSVVELHSGYDANAQPGQFFFARVKLSSSVGTDKVADVWVSKPRPADDADPTTYATIVAHRVPLGQLVDLPFGPIVNSEEGLNQDDSLVLFAAAPSGAVAYMPFGFGDDFVTA